MYFRLFQAPRWGYELYPATRMGSEYDQNNYLSMEGLQGVLQTCQHHYAPHTGLRHLLLRGLAHHDGLRKDAGELSPIRFRR